MTPMIMVTTTMTTIAIRESILFRASTFALTVLSSPGKASIQKLVAGTGSCPWHPRNPLDIDTRCCGGAVTVRSRLRILSKRLCCSEWKDSWWICVGCGYLRLSIIDYNCIYIMASWDGQSGSWVSWDGDIS